MHTRISIKVKKMADLLNCYKNVTKEFIIILYLPKSSVAYLAIFNWKVVSFFCCYAQCQSDRKE